MSANNDATTLLPPPEGYVVHLENPQRTYVSQFYGVYAAGLTTMWFFVAQNLYVRWYLQRRFKDLPTSALVNRLLHNNLS